MNNEINNEVVDFGFNLSDIINSLDDDSNIEKSNEIEKLNESKIDTLKCVLDNYQQTDRKCVLHDTRKDIINIVKI